MSGRDLSLDSGAENRDRATSPSTPRASIQGRATEVGDAQPAPPEAKLRVSRNGLRLLSRVDLPPGRYTAARPRARDVTVRQGGIRRRTTRQCLTSPRSELSVERCGADVDQSGLGLTTLSLTTADQGRPPAAPIALAPSRGTTRSRLFAEVCDAADGPSRTPSTSTRRSSALTKARSLFKNEEERQSSELQVARAAATSTRRRTADRI